MASWPIRKAAGIIKQGGVIAYPTETVYGLGCDPLCFTAIQRLLDIKQRPFNKGLILLADSFALLQPFIESSAEIQRTLETPSQQPVTWIVPAHKDTPPWLTGGRSTIAVRISCHPSVQALCQLTNRPLVSTSVNFKGQKPINNPYVLRSTFGTMIDIIVPGKIQRYAMPSKIIDWQTRNILR